MKRIAKGLYQHYKGKYYEVIGLAHHSETLEELVVYIALYKTKYGNKSLWVRPAKMFLETIKIEGKSVKRFQKIRKKLSPRTIQR